MSNKQKDKGNAGERKIADFLSKLYGHKFIRVPNSGAYMGGKNVFRKTNMDAGQISTFKADLIPPTNMKKLVIESKFYSEFSFHNLLKNVDIPLLDKWIAQVKTGLDHGDFWVVIFRINRRGSFIVFDNSHELLFKIGNHSNYKTNIITDFESFFSNNKQAIFDLVYTDDK